MQIMGIGKFASEISIDEFFGGFFKALQKAEFGFL